MVISVPRIMIAALRGGAGKTTLTLGLVAAWRKQGKRAATFKKGPDYIDAGWLSKASGGPCYNLDNFFLPAEEILESFQNATLNCDVAVIEGNRGLFDGMDSKGSCSSAQLSKLLRCPVILIVDVTKTTRTAAAVVKGCQVLDPYVEIAGVILNKVANPRHEKILRESIEQCCDLKVLGAVPKLKRDCFPERHMGLVTSLEHGRLKAAIDNMAGVVEENIDLDKIYECSRCAQAFYTSRKSLLRYTRKCQTSAVTIGVIQDSAFQFYYPENLEALKANGATVLSVSALKDSGLPPELDALYIGGGFPETHANILSANTSFRRSLKRAINKGLPVYAECGGLMFLTETLIWEGKRYPMVGSIPAVALMEEKPQGHGYTVLEVHSRNPFFPVGLTLRGHEFHYSRLVDVKKEKMDLIFKVKRGRGICKGRDGIRVKNTLASYTHLHARSSPVWADSFVELATWYRLRKEQHSLLECTKSIGRDEAYLLKTFQINNI